MATAAAAAAAGRPSRSVGQTLFSPRSRRQLRRLSAETLFLSAGRYLFQCVVRCIVRSVAARRAVILALHVYVTVEYVPPCARAVNEQRAGVSNGLKRFLFSDPALSL